MTLIPSRTLLKLAAGLPAPHEAHITHPGVLAELLLGLG